MTTLLRTAISLSILLLSYGCGTSTSPTDTLSFEEANEKWTDRGQSSYQFRFHWICYCPSEFVEPVDITVTSNVITSVVNAQTLQPLEEGRYSDYKTIDELFMLIGDAYGQDPHEIRTEFHSTEYYPTNVFIDFNEKVIDEENGFAISWFSFN